MKGREGSRGDRVGQDLQVHPSAKPRFLMLLQLKGQNPSHPRHSSFSREQQQLHTVKLWPLPCQMSTTPAVFHRGYSSVPPASPHGPWSAVMFVYLAEYPGLEICMTLHHPLLSHAYKTIQMREQHRSDSHSTIGSQHPVHPGDPPASPKERLQSLYTVAFSMFLFFFLFFKTCFEAPIKTQKYRTIKNQHKFCLSQRPIYS